MIFVSGVHLNYYNESGPITSLYYLGHMCGIFCSQRCYVILHVMAVYNQWTRLDWTGLEWTSSRIESSTLY